MKLSFLRGAADALASVLFAAPCQICSSVSTTASLIPICEGCFASLQPLRGPACVRCGRPFASEVVLDARIRECFACRHDAYAFDSARSYGPYTDQMVRAISLLKYEKLTRLGQWFAERLLQLTEAEPGLRDADVVVPVPLHPARLRERGYNQADLIARPLARNLKLPLRPYLLVRTKPRPPRLLLSRRERWLTVRGAYELRKGAQVDNLRVLLIDDVFTTGTTLDACARALKKAGAKRVVGLTVARAISQASLTVAGPTRRDPTRQPQSASNAESG